MARRALRIALDALETRSDPATLARLVQARPPAAPRERRRLAALRAADLEESGATREAAALREEILREAKRDDAAAIVLAREMRGAEPAKISDRLLLLLIDTARAQRDLELAETLLLERDRRAAAGADADERLAARFELARLYAARGRFAEAAAVFRSLLALKPAHPRKGHRPGDDSSGHRRILGPGPLQPRRGAREARGDGRRGEGAGPRREGARGAVEALDAPAGADPDARGKFERAEAILRDPALAREPGRVEGLLTLVLRRAEAGDGPGARRTLDTVVRARASTASPRAMEVGALVLARARGGGVG